MKITIQFSLFLFVVSSFLTPAFAGDASIDLAAIRKAIEAKGAKWVAADNPLLHLSPEQRKNLASLRRPTLSPGQKIFHADMSVDLPQNLDWRDYGGDFVTDVKNQNLCGSCWAFASVAALESRMAIAGRINHPTTDYSEQHIISCDHGSCDGGSFDGAYEYIQSNGIPDEDCFPYAGANLSCSESCEDWRDRRIFIDAWMWVTMDSADETAIKTALLDGPVAAGIDIYDDFMTYSSGVYEHVTGGYEGAHAVMILGWDDSQETWIIKNSWGEEWGMDGFGLVKYGTADVGVWTAEPIVPMECQGCTVDESCFGPGEVNPVNPCEVCKPQETSDAWTLYPDGTECDDGQFCNGTDQCAGGECSVHSGDPCQDDSDFCNGIEYCDYDTEQCVSSGDPCTSDQNCDMIEQKCTDKESRDKSDNKSDSGCGG